MGGWASFLLILSPLLWQMKLSTVIGGNGTSIPAIKIRISHTSYLHPTNHTFLPRLNARLSLITGLSMRTGEGVMKEAENLQVRDTCKCFVEA